MKKLARLLVVVLVALVALGVAAVLFVDSLTRSAVERGGSYALGVPTTLEKASIGIFSGAFALRGLSVANPPGFAEPAFFAMRSAELELPLQNLTGKRIEIPALVLSGITLDLERNARGTNYGTILANLERFQSAPGGGSAAGADQDPRGSGKVFRLGALVLRDIRATVQLLPQAGDLTRVELAIPEVRVQGLANDLSMAELCALVVRTVVDAAVRQGGDTLPIELLEDLRGQVEDLEASARAQLEEAAAEAQQGLDQELQEAAKKLGPEAEAAAKKASEALGNSLGGLLERNKKKD